MVFASVAGQRVIKGGSYLCAPEYCLRYRPGARQPQEEDLAKGIIDAIDMATYRVDKKAAMQIALDAVRVHGGYGYSTEYDVERYFRDAPLMIVGEGTNEIQKGVIAKQLVKRGGLGI